MGRDDLFDLVMRMFDGEEVPTPENEVSVPFTPELMEGCARGERAALTDPCSCCGERRWWRLKPAARRRAGPWVCALCHPPQPPPEAIEWANDASTDDSARTSEHPAPAIDERNDRDARRGNAGTPGAEAQHQAGLFQDPTGIGDPESSGSVGPR